MGSMFDQKKTKHQLLHASVSLIVMLLCTSYVHKDKNWKNVGRFWDSPIILFLFLGETVKLALSNYFSRDEKETILHKQKRKSYITDLRNLASGLLLQVVCTVFYGFICIILGAPALHNYEQTFVLSLLLTILSVSPTVFLLGTSRTLQVVFCEKVDFLTKSEETALELFKCSAAGAICGAWAGSIVAPLDWDREWQAYPIPNVIGALLGCSIANIYFCSKILLTVGKLYVTKKRN